MPKTRNLTNEEVQQEFDKEFKRSNRSFGQSMVNTNAQVNDTLNDIDRQKQYLSDDISNFNTAVSNAQKAYSDDISSALSSVKTDFDKMNGDA